MEKRKTTPYKVGLPPVYAKATATKKPFRTPYWDGQRRPFWNSRQPPWRRTPWYGYQGTARQATAPQQYGASTKGLRRRNVHPYKQTKTAHERFAHELATSKSWTPVQHWMEEQDYNRHDEWEEQQERRWRNRNRDIQYQWDEMYWDENND